MDQRGYVMSGLSLLLVVPAFLLLAVFVEMTQEGGTSVATTLQSDTAFYVAKNIEEEIPTLGLEVLRSEAEKTSETGNPLTDSEITVKQDIQRVMDEKTEEYHNSTGVEVNCTILNVGPSPDPFAVEVNSTVCTSKGSITHNERLKQEISIGDAESRILDPIPFIKCRNYGGVTNTSDRILYGSSLENYLKIRGIPNAEAYKNSSTPLFIKKCPYDPYVYHGQSKNRIALRNCLENGYSHESSDGACFLCRLEGKSTCPHYGFETFIKPAPFMNKTFNSAPCSSDHVIFNDTNPDGSGTYKGNAIEYYTDGTHHFYIFLDNGHASKYGLI